MDDGKRAESLPGADLSHESSRRHALIPRILTAKNWRSPARRGFTARRCGWKAPGGGRHLLLHRNAPQTTRDPEDLSALEAAEIAAQRALVTGNVVLEDGSGLLAANFEPRVVENGGWEAVRTGLRAPRAAGLWVGGKYGAGRYRAGSRGDRRRSGRCPGSAYGRAGLGANGAYVVANGLLDVFVTGEAVTPRAVTTALTPRRAAAGSEPGRQCRTLALTRTKRCPAGTVPCGGKVIKHEGEKSECPRDRRTRSSLGPRDMCTPGTAITPPP